MSGGARGQASDYRLVIFTGSDWCANCRRLEKNVLADTAFAAYLLRRGIRVERVDFPQHKKLTAPERDYNAAQAERFGFMGSYPSLYLASGAGTVLGQILYENEPPQALISQIERRLAKP